MHSTPVSLLQRLKQPDDRAAWERFVELYTPLLFFWGQRIGLPRPEVEDLVQDVFAVLVRKLPEFQYDPQRTFRGWLRTVVMNQWRQQQRKPTVDTVAVDNGDFAGREPDAAAWFEEEEFRQVLTQRTMQILRADFDEKSWQGFWRTVVEGQSAPQVAAELGTTPGAVNAAKFRILKRLQEELAGMLD